MFDGLTSAALDRMTLMANHVLSSEPQAVQRLQAHAGKVVDATGLLPALAPMLMQGAQAGRAWCSRITPAGLLERVAEGPCDATVGFTTQSLTQVLKALRERDLSVVQVRSDAPALESDLQWVVEHVRWDYAADIERVLPASVGPVAARTAQQVTEGLSKGFKAVEGWLTRGSR
jgi:ubiquinone biosynthesis accessory factor UbiJ